MKRVGYGVLLLLSCGCSGASGIAYDRLGVDVSELDSTGAASDTISHCLTLPLLLGSRVEDEYPIEEGLSLAVVATREGASLTSSGAVVDVERSYSASDLEGGLTDSFDLSALSGSTFSVDVHSGCSP